MTIYLEPLRIRCGYFTLPYGMALNFRSNKGGFFYLRRFSDIELLHELKRVARDLGRTPKGIEMSKAGAPCKDLYVQRFGSFVKACEIAGLTPTRTRRGLSDEELLQKLREIASYLGRVPSGEDLSGVPGRPDRSTYTKRFGGLCIALRKAGLTPNESYGLEDNEMLTELRDTAALLGRPPLADELPLLKLPTAPTYRSRFGSYTDALVLSGVGFNPRTSGSFRGVRCVAGDGVTVCNSLAEAKITNFLLKHGIKFVKEPHYPESRLRADWEIGGVFIEYFGLAGKPFYDKKLEIKRSLCSRSGIDLVEVYPSDLGDLGTVFARFVA